MQNKHDYTYRSLRDERQYNYAWYSGLWKLLRPLLVGVTTLVLVIGIAMTAWNKVYDQFIAPANTDDPQPVIFDVENGQSLNRVSRNLEAAGLIRSSTFFKYFCDFSGFGQKIQVGTYTLTPDMSVQAIADLLTTGDGNPLVRNITLIPGWTLEEFAAYLVKRGVLQDAAEFLRLCQSGESFGDFAFVDTLLRQPNRKQKYLLEGYLAANTYEVYTSATPEEIIRKLLRQTASLWPEEYELRAAELGMSMNEIFTLASMIEKEAGTADFSSVSAVFHNRLKAGMTLGSDVTIHYITGIQKMSLSADDLQIANPYNTYANKGLPPGPICAPSANAIQAALYPNESYLADKYLYFCAKVPGSGELYFSRTLAEHEQAVAIYAPLWAEYDKERGIE